MLKTASFGGLFSTAFVINAVSHGVMGLVGVLVAFLSPTNFNADGVPTQTPAAALGVLAVLLLAATVINAASSAFGAGVWMMLRRLFFRRSRADVF